MERGEKGRVRNRYSIANNRVVGKEVHAKRGRRKAAVTVNEAYAEIKGHN
jgi:hypothetical protein